MNKKLLLLTALVLSSVQAQAVEPAVTPLSGTVTLMNAAGESVGEVTTYGLLFTGPSREDVTALRVSATGVNDASRATAYRLLTGGTRALELFGPAGQHSVIAFPNVKTIEWVALNGKTTSMTIR
ncbi:hypothetical protein IHN32_03430 [Deinococcus sp. 14RED07]|uniref:hypothetical protein n=1 Tax=Deinococcus sp. 14RED07 TaxID=2745874 RepID=UPI001E4A6A8C|nr:hypothetical protein [Deinococcus sp. 14RED07]MCD0175001.1 hypothetical protein [Deinococcus sp. 14RED07]